MPDLTVFENYFLNPLEFVVLALFAGISAAILLSTYRKRVDGELVRRLLAAQARDEGSARTLGELQFRKKNRSGKDVLLFAYRGLALTLNRPHASLLRTVMCTEEKDAPPVVRHGRDTGRRLPPLAQRHYFIEESKAQRAAVLYGDRARWSFSVLAVVLCAAAALLAHFFADELTTMAQNFIRHYFS